MDAILTNTEVGDVTETATTPRRWRTMPRSPAFWLLALVMGFLMFAAAAPSPMYVIYQARWQFSATTLAIVFAVYALAVLAALVAFGSVSDDLGRRPVLIGPLVLQDRGHGAVRCRGRAGLALRRPDRAGPGHRNRVRSHRRGPDRLGSTSPARLGRVGQHRLAERRAGHRRRGR